MICRRSRLSVVEASFADAVGGVHNVNDKFLGVLSVFVGAVSFVGWLVWLVLFGAF